VASYLVGKEPWTDGHDLAFIYLPPHLVGNVAKDSVFIDAEKNFAKSRPDDYSSLIPVDSVFGLVEKFTGGTTREGGRATTVLRGVLTSGVLRDIDDLNV